MSRTQLTVLLALASACSSSPMDYCKQLAAAGVAERCSEDVGHWDSKVSTAVAFHAPGYPDVDGRIVLYKSDDEFHAANRELALGENARLRVIVFLYGFSAVDRSESARLDSDTTLKEKIQTATAALK